MNENKKIVEHGPTGLKRIPIGISDYRKLKTGDYYIVDKSLLIKEFLDSGAEVTSSTLWENIEHEYDGRILRHHKGFKGYLQGYCDHGYGIYS